LPLQQISHKHPTLGNLYQIYSDVQLEDAVKADAVKVKVLASLEKHWAAANQEPFIAAVILNPFLCGKC
jgi:hypothetical protein